MLTMMEKKMFICIRNVKNLLHISIWSYTGCGVCFFLSLNTGYCLTVVDAVIFSDYIEQITQLLPAQSICYGHCVL